MAASCREVGCNAAEVSSRKEDNWDAFEKSLRKMPWETQSLWEVMHVLALHHCNEELQPGLWVIGIILMCLSMVRAAGAQRNNAKTSVTRCTLKESSVSLITISIGTGSQ